MITLINTNTPLAINSYANSKFNRYNSCVFFLFLLLLSGNKAFSQPVGSAATQAAGKQQKFVLSPTLEADKFHAIIIACSKYTGSKWPALASATADADSLKNELVAEYGFSKQNVVTLYNLNKRDILKGLYKKLDSLGEHDNVVIFYSGHGTIDYATNIAYWVPLNAEGRYDYISNSEITTALANTKAKHVLIIADASYSGAMRSPAFDDGYNDSLSMRAKSTQILTSGAAEAIPGAGVFVPTILLELKLNSSHYMLASQLYINIAKTIMLQTGKTPIFKPLEGVRNSISYGMFYFRKNIELCDATGPATSY